MVMDPTLAAKHTAKGVKGTVKLTTKVTGSIAKGAKTGVKGGYGVAKTGMKGTTKVVGKTIDGVRHGATGLFVKKDGEFNEEEFDFYDPSVLKHRRKHNTLERFIAGESTQDNKIDSLHNAGIPIRSADFLAPSIDLGGGGGGGGGGSWDL